MGTVDPIPPRGPLGPNEKPWWASPFLLGAAAVIIAGVAYKAGRREEAPPARPLSAMQAVERPPAYVVVPTPPASPVPTPTATAVPEPTPAMVVKHGAALAVDSVPSPAPQASDPYAAKEKFWRDRYTAAKTRVELAQSALDQASNANPVVYLRDGGISAAGLAARNAALTPYQLELDAAKADLATIPEACRVAGCLPGWIR